LELIEESRNELNRRRKDIPLAISTKSLCVPRQTFVRGRIGISKKYTDQA